MDNRLPHRRYAQIRSYRQNHSLLETARKFKIRDPKGRPSKALVSLLQKGWEPRTAECRKRCGLPVRLRKPKPAGGLLDGVQIHDQPEANLRWALEHREAL
jgi:hypothetical protein